MSYLEGSVEYSQGALLVNPDLVLDRILDVRDIAEKTEWLVVKYIPWIESEWEVVKGKIDRAVFMPDLSKGGLGSGGRKVRVFTLGGGKILSEEKGPEDTKRKVILSYSPYPQGGDVLMVAFETDPYGKLLAVTVELSQIITKPSGINVKRMVRKAEINVTDRTLSYDDHSNGKFQIIA